MILTTWAISVLKYNIYDIYQYTWNVFLYFFSETLSMSVFNGSTVSHKSYWRMRIKIMWGIYCHDTAIFYPWCLLSAFSIFVQSSTSVNWVSIGSGNGFAPSRQQAVTWTNADLLSTGPLGTNFSENLIEILTFSFKKMSLKMSSAKWQPFCPWRDKLIN